MVSRTAQHKVPDARSITWMAMHTKGEVLPIAFSATVLLGFLGVGVGKAVLGKEFGDMLLWEDSAVGQAGVVLVTELVRASH
jgi:hypothetical protein